MNAATFQASATQAPPVRGWRACLELRFENIQSQTEIAHRRHEGPLLVQKALHPERRPVDAGRTESNPCHVYVIHPPGGVASGDHLELDVALRPGAHALLTTPAAGKYYRRGSGGESRVLQTFAADSGVLEWLPQENIFYPNAAVDLASVVRLSSGARYIGWEIGCVGLPACHLSLQEGVLRLGLELWLDGRPLLVERLKLDQTSVDSRWGMAGHTAFGTALFYPAGKRELDAANANIEKSRAKASLACTLVDGVLACRGLGHRADLLRGAFVNLWRELRPLLLGREAIGPRIWAT